MVLIIHSMPIFFVIPRSAATKRRISGTFTAERVICCSMRDYQFFAYIMAIKSRVLYTGFSNDLRVRVLQHKIGCLEGFTRRYRVHRLVYFESYRSLRSQCDCTRERDQAMGAAEARRINRIHEPKVG